MTLAWQPSLLDTAEAPDFDRSFAGLTRHQLDERAWVDHVPGWVTASDQLFTDLLATSPWKQRDMVLYGRVVDQPRLTAFLDVDALPPLIDEMRSALSKRYEVEFDSCLVNLYRDGRDSVAWHRDRIPKHIVDPIVVTVSLGHRRKFLLRPRGQSAAAMRFDAGHGDLVVMGGTSQRTWEHTVPKVAVAPGPRMSVTFRHS